MGGKEGGRGYLYQGIVAVLEALERPDWDRIYVEFPTEGDKVDIALRSAGEITDAIQVKSTANSFKVVVRYHRRLSLPTVPSDFDRELRGIRCGFHKCCT